MLTYIKENLLFVLFTLCCWTLGVFLFVHWYSNGTITWGSFFLVGIELAAEILRNM